MNFKSSAQKLVQSGFFAAIVIGVQTRANAQSLNIRATLNNPVPTNAFSFGNAVAAVGDRIVVGAPSGAGSVSVFNLDGSFLTVITNPATSGIGGFGASLGPLGEDRFIVSAPGGEGRVYVYSISGFLLNTISNPAPTSGGFGESVVSRPTGVTLIGNPRVNVTRPEDPQLLYGVGEAYLMNTNGTLVTTFTNPAPSEAGNFGLSCAFLGSDAVVISAPGNMVNGEQAGLVYLFNTNGNLITAYTNPVPETNGIFVFGVSVKAVGDDRLLIGRPRRPFGGGQGIAKAFLFNTNGALLTVFTNPVPSNNADGFGGRVCALGTNMVLIGNDHYVTNSGYEGAVFLYNTEGKLLNTILNPKSGSFGMLFGKSIEAIGDHSAVIGSDNPGQSGQTVYIGAGSAYLVNVDPLLSIQSQNGSSIKVSWPSPWSDFPLQVNTNGLNVDDWTDINTGIQNDGTNCWLTVNPSALTGFFRLLRP